MSPQSRAAYLAGIIDGEGCLTIGAGRKGNVTNYNAVVAVVNTNEDLVKWLVRNYGGNFYHRKAVGNARSAFVWRYLKKHEIEQLLLSILPYLIIKRKQANLLLSFVRLERSEQPNVRDRLFLEMRVLNQRGLGSLTTNTQDTEQLSVKIEPELMGDHESGPAVTQVTQ